MNKPNDWYSFYEPYIQIDKILNINTIVENYINKNYSKIIEKQFEQYKEQGRYTRAGEFIDKEIKADLKNPDSYYLELKKPKKRKKRNGKDITDILSEIKKLPLIVDYIGELEYGGNREYDKACSYLRDTLELGKTFLNHPECCHYLLWIFSTTDDNSNIFQYGSNYLKTVAKLIKDKAEQFNSIDDSYYKISLECFKPYINVNNFLTQENTLDLYIRTKYPSILKDEYEYFKKKYERFKEDLTQKKILESYIETNYPNFPKDEYGHLKDKLTQDTFMRVNNLYNSYDDGRYLYNSLAKRKKKLDDELLKKFCEFKVLKEANDTTHSKEIKRLNHIRLALQMGALAFQKFPRLSTDISNAMKNAQYEGYGILYLKELSRQLNIVAYNEFKIEDNIESDYQQEKQYKENMSSQEYDEAKLLGFDI